MLLHRAQGAGQVRICMVRLITMCFYSMWFGWTDPLTPLRQNTHQLYEAAQPDINDHKDKRLKDLSLVI